jgi:hypothetical protein
MWISLQALLVAAVVLLAAETPESPLSELTPPFGAEFTARMKASLQLSDEQVTRLQPVIVRRIEGTDAALVTLESAEEPDVAGFITNYGEIKRTFEADVMKVITLDQRKPWEAFKAEFEKDLVTEGATKRLMELRTLLNLTEDQVTRMRPAMTTALQKKLDLFQGLMDDKYINVREKRRARRELDDLNAELGKSISAVLTVDQRLVYNKLLGN